MDYRPIIESKYNRENWQRLLHDIFNGKEKFWNTPSVVPTNSQFAKQALWLGTITLSDGQTISIYEVELADSVDIERNRRGIRDMLLTAWRSNGNAGAFMFCYRKHESVLRFSYVSEAWTFAEDGTYQKESTDTKRFTYLLGEGHRSRTAIQQFESLRDSSLSLKDLTKAFSVDAVSDMFFKGYKQQYEDIIFYVTGKRMVKVANKWEERQEGTPNAFIMQQFAHFSNPEKAIRDYVKKLMGRLVFLQFLQKKGWLGVPVNKKWGSGDSEFIQTLFAECKDKDHFIDHELESLFNDLNNEERKELTKYRTPYLNGGLFERDASDETEFPLPAKYMQSLLNFFASYNFTIDENDPDDAEVGVDPEMLGRIFENLLEDNKDKGAFYTPKEIVSYMCRESLIAYLQTDIEDESTQEAIRQFVTTHDVSTLGTNEKFRQQVDEALRNVKICDPAIGSGAFPMGLLKELFQCRTALEGIEQSKAAEIKKHIIQQNIYGVDIERGAVDIARLRFWLSLIVDEETPQALPNLDFKIMQGNSLLEQYKGVDLSTITELKTEKHGTYQTTMFDDMIDVLRLDLRKKLDEYYNCTDHKRKAILKQDIINNVKQQLAEQSINVDFGDLDLSGNNQFMLWHTWFYDVFSQGGFDIVIGNPPYIGEKGHMDLFRKTRQDSKMNEYYLGKMDYFYFFFHLAINMLSEGGQCSFITTNYYPTADGAKNLRLDFKKRTSLRILLHLGNLRLFDGAPGQHNMITFLQKGVDDKYPCMSMEVHRKGALCPQIFDLIISGKDSETDYYFIEQSRIYDGEDCYIRIRQAQEGSPVDSILDKIRKGKSILKDICNVNQGILTGADKISQKHINEYNYNYPKGYGVYSLTEMEVESQQIERDYVKVLYKNSDVKRYFCSQDSDERIIYFSRSTDENLIPNIIKHLFPFKSMLENRREVSTGRLRWFDLWWPRDKSIFMSEKIVCPQRSNTNTFGYTELSWFATSDVFFITKPNTDFQLKYILAILNSKLIYFWLYNRGKRKGETLELTATPISQIPIAKSKKEEQLKYISIVDQILAAKKGNMFEDTSALESEIDLLVYHLYGLTYDDVLIVDPETPITKEEYNNNKK